MSQSDLERRVSELERDVARLGGYRPRKLRYASAASIGDIPLLSIAIGPDLDKGERRGQERGLAWLCRPQGPCR